MALSGLDIYKLLPKTNCKKCGFQTCLAFAMQLAKRAVSPEQCPFVTPEVRAVLQEASEPAIRLVEIGIGERKVSTGQETVFFRHEEKFYHPTAIGIVLDDELAPGPLDEALGRINGLVFERVGEVIGVQLVAVHNKSGQEARYLKQLKAIRARCPLPFVLMPATADVLRQALILYAAERPLVYCEKPSDVDRFASLCKEFKVPLAFRQESCSAFSAATKKLVAQGCADLVLDMPPGCLSERLWLLTQARRLSIKKGERSLGFPTMVILDTEDGREAVCQAATGITKYAGIVLLRTTRPEHILSLLTLRQNIFTDPQKPLQVEARVYPVGSACEDSPVLVTTNFSLTYYTVLGEIESSRVSAHLICMDTEGMSVLTAWAAEKFTPEQISDTLLKFRLGDIVRHKNLIIPGYVAMMSGDLEEKSGWRILVGPREASGLPSFLKNLS